LGIGEKKEAQKKQVFQQEIGERCKKKDINECKQYFGEARLAQVCATCPD